MAHRCDGVSAGLKVFREPLWIFLFIFFPHTQKNRRHFLLHWIMMPGDGCCLSAPTPPAPFWLFGQPRRRRVKIQQARTETSASGCCGKTCDVPTDPDSNVSAPASLAERASDRRRKLSPNLFLAPVLQPRKRGRSGIIKEPPEYGGGGRNR